MRSGPSVNDGGRYKAQVPFSSLSLLVSNIFYKAKSSADKAVSSGFAWMSWTHNTKSSS